MTTYRVARRNRYTPISRDTLNDAQLSFRARGVLAWLLDKPEDWRCDSDAIARAATGGLDVGKADDPKITTGEGRDAIRAALRELEAARYLVRTKVQGPDGRWTTETEVHERPAEPATDAPEDDQPTDGDQAPDLFTGDGFPVVGQPAVGGPAVGSPGVGEPGPIPKLVQETETKPPPPSSSGSTTAAEEEDGDAEQEARARARAACDLVGLHHHRNTKGEVRLPEAHLAKCQEAARARHWIAVVEAATAHPDRTPEALAENVLRNSSGPNAMAGEPARQAALRAISDENAERRRAEAAAPPPDPAAVAAARAEARAALDRSRPKAP